MSGAMTLGTIATLLGAGAAVGGLGYGIYSGQKQQDVQQQQLAHQRQAEQQAEGASLSQERQNAVAQNAANQKTPNVAQILARAAQQGNVGQSSTMLTGPAGVGTGSLNLGGKTLLGS